jgi:hypothetical protein
VRVERVYVVDLDGYRFEGIRNWEDLVLEMVGCMLEYVSKWTPHRHLDQAATATEARPASAK